ncbi:hypothetical protein ACIRJR_20900 [Streptomyces sp. NPDC102402]|uniref:hypothetical protein n=1 Tax=Streptomyces sp. NPDC102402 TaxID=3366169 RepID=UPI003826DAC7
MRMRLRTAALLAAWVPLTACGIQETDVIGAGSAATVDVLPARQVRMLLFFLSPDAVLVPVPRTVGESQFPGEQQGPEEGEEAALPATEKTISALLAGPNEAEKRAGLVNDASLPDPAAVKVSDDGVDVALAAPLGGLSRPAEWQLVCTVAFAESAQGTATVTLRGTDGTRDPARCDLQPGAGGTATETGPR